MDPHSKVLEDLAKSSRIALKIDKERAELFLVLLRHPAWKLYEGLLESLIQSKADVIMGPAGSLEGAMVLEYVKGAMSGLIMAKDLPSSIIADMKSASASSGDEE